MLAVPGCHRLSSAMSTGATTLPKLSMEVDELAAKMAGHLDKVGLET